jgi:hypothetical protein
VVASVATLFALTDPPASAQTADLRIPARSPMVRLDPGGLRPGASFGTSVDISGNVAVVGAPSLGGGQAYIYTRVADGWREAAELRGPNKPGAFFGGAVAIAGGTIAVGADNQDNAAGRVFDAAGPLRPVWVGFGHASLTGTDDRTPARPPPQDWLARAHALRHARRI